MIDTLTFEALPSCAQSCDALDEIPIAYVEVNAQGIITRANRAARVFHSAHEGDIVGISAFAFSPTEESEKDQNAFLAMMESGVDPPVTRRELFTGTGEYRIFELHRKLIRDEEGRPTGVRGLTVDITEAQNAHREARRAVQWLESVLESISEAVIVTDTLGFVRLVNSAAETLFGFQAAELIGGPIEVGLPILCLADAARNPLEFSMTLARPQITVATMRNRERQELKVEISTSPILDKETGATMGVVSVWRRAHCACPETA
jgi:PAS domain S-box-containing protein